MYIPGDFGRLPTSSNATKNALNTFLSSSICPINTADANSVFKLKEDEFQFENIDGIYKPDIGIRIPRTPLQPTDPSTYISISPVVESNLRKYYTSFGNLNHDPIKNPLSIKEINDAIKPDQLPLGSGINPLIADYFKPVHLTPGCIAEIVSFDAMYQANTGGTGSNGGGGHSSGGGGHTSILGRTNSVYNRNTSSLGKKILWGKKPLDEGHSSSSVNDLKQPKSSLNRSSSAFISKVTTCDNLHKKLNQANELIIAAHGRFFNILNSNDDYTKIEAENPYIRVLFNIGIITSIACFIHSFPHDKNLDIAIAFSTGDLVWINPFKMKYTRFNKNAKLLNKPIISVRWSNCGRYILAGFSNGEVMVFNRDLEEDENYFISQDLARREPHAVFYKESTLATKLNPISHFKISNKPITSIKINPVYNNFCCITSDDGFIRIIDLSKNFLSDIYESYYGGILVSEFTKDGKFLLVGGEDDFISIYELLINNISNVPINGNLRLITRLQGQSSWVRSIKVDYVKSSPKVAVYRIGGVGDDGYLNYWEFQPRRLPKIKRPLHHHNRTGSRNISGNYAPSSHNTTPNLKSGSNGTFPSQKQSQQQQQSHRRRISSLPLANLYRHSNSISSLTSSTTQQHMSLIEAIHSNSQAATSGDGYSSSSNNNNNLSSNSLIPETALSFTSNTVTWIPINLEMNKCVVHNAAGYNAVPILQPLSSKDVSLGRLSGLFFDKNYSWVFSAGGDLVRWKRP